MDEMGLVVVAAIQCDLGPIDLLRAVDRYECLLKAPYTAECLWRKPHLLAKELNESPRTEANLPRQPRNRPRKLFEQVLFKDLKHCGDAWRSEHALAHLFHAGTPQVFKTDGGVL